MPKCPGRSNAAFAAGASYGAGLAGNPRAHSQTLGVREVALVLRAVSALNCRPLVAFDLFKQFRVDVTHVMRAGAGS